MSTGNIKSAFKESGIWPINPDAVLQSGKLTPAQSLSTSPNCEPVVLPVFSPKKQAAVEKCIQVAKLSHLVCQPSMEITISISLKPQEPLILQPEREQPVTKEQSVADEINLLAGGVPAGQQLASCIAALPTLSRPDLEARLQDIQEQFKREQTAVVLARSKRVSSIPKKEKKWLKSNGQTMLLTSEEARAQLRKEEEERKTPTKRKRVTKAQTTPDGAAPKKRKRKSKASIENAENIAPNAAPFQIPPVIPPFAVPPHLLPLLFSLPGVASQPPFMPAAQQQ